MYELKVRDWNAPGNINAFVATMNRLRRDQPALQRYSNLRFYPSDDPNILFYGKMTPDKSDVVFVAVNLDPFATHSALVELPLGERGIRPNQADRVHERLTDAWRPWRRRGGRV